MVFDANQDPFPQEDFGVAFLSGLLEYVVDPRRFLGELVARAPRQIVMSYVSTDIIPRLGYRKSLRWRSHLSTRDLLTTLVGPYRLAHYAELQGNQLFDFEVAELRP